MLRHVFRTAIHGLPGRDYLIERMAAPPPHGSPADGLGPEMRQTRCLQDLQACIRITRSVVGHAKRLLVDELHLKDDRKL